MNIEFTRNPALEEELYARLRRKYEQARPEIHFSDTIGCLTKAYYSKTDPIPFSNDTWGLFAIGFALEEVLLKEAPTFTQIEGALAAEFKHYANLNDTPSIGDYAAAIEILINKSQTPGYEYEGLHFSPDYTTTLIAGEMDLKTTRMGIGDDGRPATLKDGSRPQGFPDGWLKQFMGYAHRLGAQPADSYTPYDYVDYNVGILYVIQAQLVAGTIRFAWDDVELNMAHHLHRASILEDQLAQGTPPQPFLYNEAWECKNCPYLNRCNNYDPGMNEGQIAV